MRAVESAQCNRSQCESIRNRTNLTEGKEQMIKMMLDLITQKSIYETHDRDY